MTIPTDTPLPPRHGENGPATRQPADMPVVESRQLFGRTTEIGIMHHGSLYRLKITRQGKLILNK
jgi:hemin uptake protein HemP